MTEKSYSIAYGPPLTVKDQPHRANDTARSSRDVTELEPTQAGQVMVVGGFAESDSGEIIEIAAEEVDTMCVG